MNTRTATLILFASGIVGGIAGWAAASLLGEDFFGLLHLAGLISGAWIGLLLSFLAVIQIARWRRFK